MIILNFKTADYVVPPSEYNAVIDLDIVCNNSVFSENFFEKLKSSFL